jgi:hypothetical protein
MDNVDLFRAAFADYRGALMEQFSRRIRSTFAKVVERYGPTARGVYNDWDYAKVWTETVAPVIVYTGRDVSIDEGKLTKFASEWADSEIEDAALKLAGKVANLTDVQLARAMDAAAWFTVTGTHPNGSAVRVEQNQILNVSSQGKVFNQWPALIYVNGKKTSEAAYKRL